jgi:ribosomal protein S18 acetylase RimI-like enzyme
MYFNESEDKSKLDKSFKKKDIKIDYKVIENKDVLSKPALRKKYSCLNNYREYCKKRPLGEAIVDTANDKIIGSVFVRKMDDGTNIIAGLNVDSEYRGYGFGDILFDDAIKKFDGNSLGVYADNQVALRMYKARGFDVSSTEKDEGGKWYKMKRLIESYECDYVY